MSGRHAGQMLAISFRWQFDRGGAILTTSDSADFPDAMEWSVSVWGQLQAKQDRPVESELAHDTLRRGRRGCWGWANSAIGHSGNGSPLGEIYIQTVTWLRASLDIPDLTTSTAPRRTVREGHFPDRVYYYSSIFTRNRRSIIQNTVNLPEFPFFESSTTAAATTQRFSICAKHTLNCPWNPPKIYINFGGQGYITLHPRDRVSPNRPRNSRSLSSPIWRPHPPVNTLTQQVLFSSSHLSPTTLLSIEYCCPPRQSSGPPPPPLHIPLTSPFNILTRPNSRHNATTRANSSTFGVNSFALVIWFALDPLLYHEAPGHKRSGHLTL